MSGATVTISLYRGHAHRIICPGLRNHRYLHSPASIRSTMAFFAAIDWISDGAKELTLMELAFLTQKRPSQGMYSPPTAVPWFPGTTLLKCSRLKASATFNRIRSVVLRKIFARQMASASPRKVTFPSSTWEISHSQRSRISFSGLPPDQNDRVQSVHILLSPYRSFLT